jgi:hypothetical protein
MKKSILTALTVAALALTATPTAAETDTLKVSASCNDKWVIVTVDVPDTATIVARRPGGNWIVYGNRFIPDTGGGNAAGDYDITMRLEQRTDTALDAAVIAAGKVTTPDCANPDPISTPAVERVAPIAAPAPPSPKLVTTPTYDIWVAIVDGVSIQLR